MIEIKSNLFNITDNINTSHIIKGKYENNKITYKEENIDVTILINDNKIHMTREANTYKLDMIFSMDESKSTYLLKEENLSFDIDITTKSISILKNMLKINYVVDCEYEFTLKYDVKE